MNISRNLEAISGALSVGRLVSTASELLTWNGNVEVGLIHTYRVIPVCGFGIDASSAKAVLKYYIRIESSGGAKLTSCGNRKACMAFCDSLARRAISEFYAQWRLEVGRWANTHVLCCTCVRSTITTGP